MKLVSKENVENQVEESNLVQLYHKTAAKPVAQFKGEKLNFYGLLKKNAGSGTKNQKSCVDGMV